MSGRDQVKSEFEGNTFNASSLSILDNRSISSVKRYEDRMALILTWFESWSAAKRWMLLQQLLDRCSEKHLGRIHRMLETKVPKRNLDFTRELPHHVCLKIFSLLDPRSLCRASKVCWYWKILSEDNKIWRGKCLRFGWGLPNPPLAHEVGVWKHHYIMCVYNLHWVPPKDLPLKYATERRVDEDTCDSSDSESALSSVHSLPPKEPDVISHSKSDKKLTPWRAPSKHPQDLHKKTVLWTSASDSGRKVAHKQQVRKSKSSTHEPTHHCTASHSVELPTSVFNKPVSVTAREEPNCGVNLVTGSTDYIPGVTESMRNVGTGLIQAWSGQHQFTDRFKGDDQQTVVQLGDQRASDRTDYQYYSSEADSDVDT